MANILNWLNGFHIYSFMFHSMNSIYWPLNDAGLKEYHLRYIINDFINLVYILLVLYCGFILWFYQKVNKNTKYLEEINNNYNFILWFLYKSK